MTLSKKRGHMLVIIQALFHEAALWCISIFKSAVTFEGKIVTEF